MFWKSSLCDFVFLKKYSFFFFSFQLYILFLAIIFCFLLLMKVFALCIRKNDQMMTCRAALPLDYTPGRKVAVELGKACEHQPCDKKLKVASGQQPRRN